MEEIFKDIPNYEGLYQVSNLGRVKSFIKFHGTTERILKPGKNHYGYLMVGLHNNGDKKTFQIHILVAMAFLGHTPCGFKIMVDHKNNIKNDNRLENLQLVTPRENASKDRKNKTSKYVGVSWLNRISKWISTIYFVDRTIHLGVFDTEIEAKNAYDKALSEWEQGLDLNLLYPKGRNKTSKYLGICWDGIRKKWRAIYKRKNLGYFNTELEAYEARERYILTLQL